MQLLCQHHCSEYLGSLHKIIRIHKLRGRDLIDQGGTTRLVERLQVHQSSRDIVAKNCCEHFKPVGLV